MTAICWLQYKYGFEDRYVLVGHSAGATLAFQSVSGIWNSRESTKDYPLAEFVSPVAIAGAAGIYDLKALVESFPTIPAYRNIIEGAFGKNEQTWKQASPVNLEFHSSWAKRRFSVIADSREDELIDQVQGDKMYSHLFENISELCKVSRLELQGDHDSIWSQGSEMAKVITHVVELLRGNS